MKFFRLGPLITFSNRKQLLCSRVSCNMAEGIGEGRGSVFIKAYCLGSVRSEEEERWGVKALRESQQRIDNSSAAENVGPRASPAVDYLGTWCSAATRRRRSEGEPGWRSAEDTGYTPRARWSLRRTGGVRVRWQMNKTQNITFYSKSSSVPPWWSGDELMRK